MLPNWLLGKSKSKLQEILGGGGGGTTYTAGDGIDISNGVISFDPATTPAIDPSKVDGLDDDLAALAPKTTLSNPNILINPWFTVNQRGFTTASSASGTYVADRWKVVSASDITITHGDGGITIDNTNGSTYVTMETLLPPNASKSLLGREVTMSLSKVIGATHLYKTFTMPESLPQSSTVIATVTAEDCTLRTVITGSGYVKVDVQVKEGKSITIRAIKLEIGSISTLARDPRPEYATELAKCQRYFQHYRFSAGIPIGVGYASGTTSARIAIPLAAPMRLSGNITFTTNGNENIIIHNNSNTEHTVSDLSAYVNESTCTLFATTTGLSNGTFCHARQGAGAFELNLSAEL